MVKNEHNENGTIYICYQGVGKSSTVNECDFFIDLESSNFKDVNIAFDLASQGYSVFVSSHDVVRRQISYMKEKYYPNVRVAIVYPTIDIKDEWIERLKKRYKENPTEKNKLAYLNAKDRFDENIVEMERDAYELPLSDDNVSYQVGEY